MDNQLKAPQKIKVEVESLPKSWENYFLTEDEKRMERLEDEKSSENNFLIDNEKRREMLEDYYSNLLYGMTEEELDYEYMEKLGD